MKSHLRVLSIYLGTYDGCHMFSRSIYHVPSWRIDNVFVTIHLFLIKKIKIAYKVHHDVLESIEINYGKDLF